MNMLKKSIILWASVVLMSLPVFAGEKVDSQLKATGKDDIEIEHVNGKAKITGWDKDLVQVKGELDNNAEEFIFERSSSGILIKVEMPKNVRYHRKDRSRGDNLEIFVPKESKIFYTSVNADVNVSKLQSGVGVDTVNGDINLADIEGKVRIESVNGDITSRNLNGSLRIKAVNADFDDSGSKADKVKIDLVNGDIDSDIKSPDVRVETVNGGIDLKLGEVSRLDITTVNGTVDTQFELLKNGDVEVTSVGGKIMLTMQKEVSARFDIEAHAGGRIENDITNDKERRAKYGPNRWLEFTTNDGDGKVQVETVSGRIKLSTK